MEEKQVIGLLSGEITAEKEETQYRGLELIKDPGYTGGTSIKYWM